MPSDPVPRIMPDALRAEFEKVGADVVAHIVGRPLTHAFGTEGVPAWAADGDARRHAVLWLAEQRAKEDKRRRVNDRRDRWTFGLVVVATVFTIIAAIASVLALWH